MYTKEETNARLREYRRSNGNAVTKRYEKTKNGFLMRAYRNMKSRVTGVQKIKAHLYQGKELVDKHTFYQWTLADEDFHKLFKAWEEADHNQKLSPSINRIDPDKGYILGNMEWITHSENSARARRWLH